MQPLPRIRPSNRVNRLKEIGQELDWLWELAKRTVREFVKDDCMHMAASIAYYSLFSIFPLLLGLIAILGHILEPAEVQGRLLEFTSQVFSSSAEIVARNIDGVIASRGAIGAVSVLGLLWSATAIFAAIRRSLNRAWGAERERPFLKQKLIDLGMVCGVGMIIVVSVGATATFRLAWGLMPAQVQVLQGSPFVNVMMSLLPMAFSFAVFALMYRYVPNTRVSWGDVWPGALLAAFFFEAAKNGFALYLHHFANYTLVYGSLGAVVALLFWAYLSAAILLLGAELASEYSRLKGSKSRSSVLTQAAGSGPIP